MCVELCPILHHCGGVIFIYQSICVSLSRVFGRPLYVFEVLIMELCWVIGINTEMMALATLVRISEKSQNNFWGSTHTNGRKTFDTDNYTVIT